MKIMQTLAIAALVGLGASLAAAQPASGPGPGPRASGPGPGHGPGMRAASGPGPGMRMGRWGADYTPGWGMMAPKERDEHRARMRGAKTYEECKTLQQQHHDLMAARAKERGVTAPLPQPRRDACAGLKP